MSGDDGNDGRAYGLETRRTRGLNDFGEVFDSVL